MNQAAVSACNYGWDILAVPTPAHSAGAASPDIRRSNKAVTCVVISFSSPEDR